MKTFRIASSIAMVAYLTLVFAGGRGIVLCAGEDGHVAIETAHSGAPCPSDSSTDCSESCASGSHCGSCVDTPLLTDARGLRPAGNERVALCPASITALDIATLLPQGVGLDRFAATVSSLSAAPGATVLRI